MKKIALFCVAVLAMVSCTTITKTAKTADMPASFYQATAADLEVAPERITYTMTPSAEVRRGGLDNVKRAAMQEALIKNGNADILVEPEFVISRQKRFILPPVITSVTVSGRPAKYKGFRSLNDSVWCNPIFRSGYKNDVKSSDGFRIF